jgi:hypothetical protein
MARTKTWFKRVTVEFARMLDGAHATEVQTADDAAELLS